MGASHDHLKMVSSGDRDEFPMMLGFGPGDARSVCECCLGVMLPDAREGL